MQDDNLLTDEQVAKLLNVSPSKLRADRVKRCGLPFHKLGGLARYDRQDVEAYKNASRRVFNAAPKA